MVSHAGPATGHPRPGAAGPGEVPSVSPPMPSSPRWVFWVSWAISGKLAATPACSYQGLTLVEGVVLFCRPQPSTAFRVQVQRSSSSSNSVMYAPNRYPKSCKIATQPRAFGEDASHPDAIFVSEEDRHQVWRCPGTSFKMFSTVPKSAFPRIVSFYFDKRSDLERHILNTGVERLKFALSREESLTEWDNRANWTRAGHPGRNKAHAFVLLNDDRLGLMCACTNFDSCGMLLAARKTVCPTCRIAPPPNVAGKKRRVQ